MQLWIALAIAPSVFAGSLASRSPDLVSRDTKEGDRPYPPAFCLCRSGDEDGPVDTAATDTTLTQVVCKQVPDSTFKIYDSPDKDPLHGGVRRMFPNPPRDDLGKMKACSDIFCSVSAITSSIFSLISMKVWNISTPSAGRYRSNVSIGQNVGVEMEQWNKDR